MISYSNIKKHVNLGWDEYCSLPGYSHSFLKSESCGLRQQVEVTGNMRLGSLVDAIITGGNIDMASPLYPAARDIASKINGAFGDLIARFEKQVSYTAEMEHKSFKMPVRGRLDLLLPGVATIDLKITKSRAIEPLINHFGYDNQLWHYAKMARTPKGYLMVYSIPLKRTLIFSRPIDTSVNEFWAEKIIKFGSYAE